MTTKPFETLVSNGFVVEVCSAATRKGGGIFQTVMLDRMLDATAVLSAGLRIMKPRNLTAPGFLAQWEGFEPSGGF